MSLVTVWQIALDVSTTNADVATLSVDERDRVARFATESLTKRWIAGHVAMRRILAKRLGVAPSSIEYSRGEFGKPHVTVPSAAGLEFSYSDADGLALLAVSTEGPVGVDIEPMRSAVDLLAIAESRFAPEEREMLRGAPEGSRTELFYRVWTRKEAVLKAMGSGLTGGLGTFSVLAPDRSLAAAHGFSVATGPLRWRLHDLPLPTGVIGALATSERATGFTFENFDAEGP